MKKILSLLLLGVAVMALAGTASVLETITINSTSRAPLLDGHCDDKEWLSATKFELPANTAVYLMHNKHSFFVCAKGKANDYTVVDVYIEHPETGQLYNLHASAQLGERVMTGKTWDEFSWWNNKDWSGFWVPYAGEEETKSGKRTKFLEGSHREVQILKKKFAGNTLNMMIRLSGLSHNGQYGAVFFYPEKAIDTDKLTWSKMTFAD